MTGPAPSRRIRLALALAAGAVALPLVTGATAGEDVRHYVLHGQNRGSHGKATAKFVGLTGSGLLNLTLGGGSVGGPLNVTRTEEAFICGKGKACVRNPVCDKVRRKKEPGGVSFKVVGTRVKVSWNFPNVYQVCAFSVPPTLGEQLEKTGLLTKTVPLSLFGGMSFTIALEGAPRRGEPARRRREGERHVPLAVHDHPREAVSVRTSAPGRAAGDLL